MTESIAPPTYVMHPHMSGITRRPLGIPPVITQRPLGVPPVFRTIPKTLNEAASEEDLFFATSFERYRTTLRQGTLDSFAVLKERTDRLRCIEAFEVVQKVLLQVGVPGASSDENVAWKARGIRTFNRMLLSSLNTDLVRQLALAELLSVGKAERDAVAHVDVQKLNGHDVSLLADQLQALSHTLLNNYETWLTRHPRFGENRSELFYRMLSEGHSISTISRVNKNLQVPSHVAHG